MSDLDGMCECSADEQRACLLEMLKYIDTLCHEHKITYFLSGGSAIGALRHHGFIPWDDDADIMMPRQDYIKFLDLTKDLSGKYKTGSLYGNYDWTFPFARMWDITTKVVYDNLAEASTGIFIDIYPMDGLPNSKNRTRMHYIHNKICYVLLNAAIRKRFKDGEHFLLLKKSVALISKKIGAKNICLHLDRVAARRKFEYSKYVGCSVLAHYMEKEWFSRKDFISMVYVDFEDTKLPVANGCNDYLTRLYGDYMNPPAGGMPSEHHMRVYMSNQGRL